MKLAKKITNIILSTLLAFSIFSLDINAETLNVDCNETSTLSTKDLINNNPTNIINDTNIQLSNDIIGGSYKSYSTLDNTFSNRLIIDYDCTAESIILKYTNIGIDSIDTVSSSITINGVTKNVKPFRAPIGRTTKTVAFNMKKCHEDISVITLASDGGDSLGTQKSPGKRDLKKALIDTWHQGTFSSKEASINYHFKTHGAELGLANIESYVKSSIAFKNNLKGATTSKVNGGTLGVTRYKKNKKYIDICGTKNLGLIISYGKQ